MNKKRLLSFAIVAFFCLLCLGTSRAPGPSVTGAVGGGGVGGGGVTGLSSAPVSIPHSAPIKGRIDPFDPKLKGGKSHYDAYVLTLATRKKYRVVVRPDDDPDAGATDASSPEPGPDAGADALWFSVQVRQGGSTAGRPLSVQERVHDGGSTEATFETLMAGPYTIIVTVFFGRGAAAKPGFSTYELEVTPSSSP